MLEVTIRVTHTHKVPALLPWDRVALLSRHLALHRATLLAGNRGALLRRHALTLRPRYLFALLGGGAIAETDYGEESLGVFTLEPTCTAGGGPSGTAVWGPVGIVALAPVHTAVSALVGIAVVAPRNTAVVAQSGTAALTLARKPGSKIFFIQVSSFST